MVRKDRMTRFLKEIVKLALQGTQPTEISKITGKSRSTIWSYLDEASKQNLIQKTSTGRIQLPKQIKDSRVYEIIEKDKFVKKYKAVSLLGCRHANKKGRQANNCVAILS